MAFSSTAKRAAVVAASTLALALGMTGTSHALARDGLDPNASGCSSDAFTARQAHILDRDGRTYIGVVELRYSPSCRTTWVRVQGDQPYLHGKVQRTQDYAQQECGSVDYSASLGQYYCFSPMLNDAGYTSYAFGYEVRNGVVSNEAITTIY
ncbi:MULTISPECIES: DUF2690 domain-containing protein [unclassified Streptomyces]|uniref:DUF2690 domain-containing protein n=1 Tax=unclassified Streptomyces TaxID=2593676 RepID=UPI0013B8E2D7|nr:DUF2690 domain-containing protein [Streptomyces sp. SID7909]NEC06146.1 DUF2690 domain-containing protein [Streptomyces sp. SID7909]